ISSLHHLYPVDPASRQKPYALPQKPRHHSKKNMLPQVNLIRAKNGDFLAFYEKHGISRVLTEHGVWDELTVAIARTLVDMTDMTPTILDIGANLGTFTVALAKHIAPRGGKS